ncbi:hypothetical protein K7432_012876 [Basidiobolus ranarum]|uniref:IgA Peptidase M64 n=1 Tax=Basidiobolus ranarum TaxID=34480 RepID=A0ABR2WK71_9FUNG
MKSASCLLLCLFSFATADFSSSHHILASRDGRSCQIIREGTTQQIRVLKDTGDVLVEERPQKVDHHGSAPTQSGRILELIGHDPDAVRNKLNEHCDRITEVSKKLVARAISDEVIPISKSGDPANRIDVVFMGDGYQESEKQRFVNDMKRLTEEMFTGNTFASYLPLFNIWGLFRPSVDSGIGIGGKPKDTPFGLYRDGTELRGIYPAKEDEARAACNALKPYQCDFPSLIGNDDYYGGLGGEFVISTRSPTSGTIVLRHEMGHSFNKVGEEYDGGEVYEGVNSAPSLDQITWKQWLTGPLKEQRNVQRVQNYAWYDLAKGPYNISFTSDGKYDRWFMRLSVSGAEVPDSFEAFLDGKPLAWNTSGILDRSFYTWFEDQSPLSAGNHTLLFKSGIEAKPGAPIRQLCSVTLHEYGKEPEYHWDNAYINAYPTFDIKQRKTYRPSNERCLMRNMASEQFCSPCKEGLWLKFLSRVSVIDELKATPTQNGIDVAINLAPIKLAHLRKKSVNDEKYTLTWYKDGKIQLQYTNKPMKFVQILKTF